MSATKMIPVVDLFAGPGGLGEGFSSVNDDPFRIIVSAEMEASARNTLRLRAFYRLLKRKGQDSLHSYYRYCNDGSDNAFDKHNESAWIESGQEALQLTLGNPEHNGILDRIIQKNSLGDASPWVLIGGPPCQAYSVVGRSRNRGKADYKPEEDHRHFLYREYLRIIQKYRPTIFVMENVKGIISSSVGGQQIFHTILRDLADPDLAFGEKQARAIGYRIHSLVCPTYFEKGQNPAEIDPRDFIVRSEDYGIPQSRHRVILLGIREDIDIAPQQLVRSVRRSVGDAIGALPPLRSKVSKEPDGDELWAHLINRHFRGLEKSARRAGLGELAETLNQYPEAIFQNMSFGGLRVVKDSIYFPRCPNLERWYDDKLLKVWLNHETRGHMSSDLLRYAYAASFAQAKGRSPKGHTEFSLPGLRPNHENWESGKFSDRFRVQLTQCPATTVTSHISKDGHYFIHPDPAQCRSLTVREAARLQTFPDNYFFKGNRTQQFHQVGNAVPPVLALKIAEVVKLLIEEMTFKNTLSLSA